AFVSRLKLRPGTRVLDVACGTGNTLIPAARAGAEVTGVDIATNLVEQARARAAKEALKVEVREGDAEQLEFPDSAFDVAMSTFRFLPLKSWRSSASILDPRRSRFRSWTRTARRLSALIWRSCGMNTISGQYNQDQSRISRGARDSGLAACKTKSRLVGSVRLPGGDAACCVSTSSLGFPRPA